MVWRSVSNISVLKIFWKVSVEKKMYFLESAATQACLSLSNFCFSDITVLFAKRAEIYWRAHAKMQLYSFMCSGYYGENGRQISLLPSFLW